jgi:pimeloyl-ACP methyl ester carboxylesterase
VSTRVGKLAVRDTGPDATSGEVIVLWPSILSDHRIYRNPIEAWRGRHRLIVGDGPGHGDSGPGFSDRFVAWGARWMHATGLYRDGVARAFFLAATRKRGGPLMEDFDHHLEQADGPALAQSVRSVLIKREPLAPRMADIAAPTLFVAGRQDAMYPLEGLRSAAAALPQGRFEVLDTAHISVVDAPEQTTALIERFLQLLPLRGR